MADEGMNNVAGLADVDGPRPFQPDNALAGGAPFDSDDFRFCYAGCAGSSTPLHRDGTQRQCTHTVYTSYSWSTNIAGRKRWRLFAPSDAALLRRTYLATTFLLTAGFPDQRTSEVAPSYAEMERRRAAGTLGHYQDGYEGWPGWEDVRVRVYTVEQAPGQTLFVPSNWYHEVENLTDCISVRCARTLLTQLNHNWWNAVNLLSMYVAMEDESDDVAAALSDVRELLQAQNAWEYEFTRITQQVVEQDAGWAWAGFWRMVLHNLQRPPCDVRATRTNY